MRTLFALCCYFALTAQAEIFTAKVIMVMDGDTVMVLREGGSEAAVLSHSRDRQKMHRIKIRLANIDAPEVGHAGMGGKPPNSQKAQPFGSQSRNSLLEMVGKKQVQIDSQAVDKYGRIVGLISVDGRNINEEQVRRGMAWASGWESPGRRVPAGVPSAGGNSRQHSGKSYIDLQRAARRAHRGLWSQTNPQAPWLWRKLHSSAITAPLVR